MNKPFPCLLEARTSNTSCDYGDSSSYDWRLVAQEVGIESLKKDPVRTPLWLGVCETQGGCWMISCADCGAGNHFHRWSAASLSPPMPLAKSPVAPSLAVHWLQVLSIMWSLPSPVISKGRGHMTNSPQSQSAMKDRGGSQLAVPAAARHPYPRHSQRAAQPGRSSHKDCWLPIGRQHFIFGELFCFVFPREPAKSVKVVIFFMGSAQNHSFRVNRKNHKFSRSLAMTKTAPYSSTREGIQGATLVSIISLKDNFL